jgi:hypothetical protein
VLELTPNDPIILAYVKDLHRLKQQDITHELGLKAPFQTLLDKAARKRGWTLVPELSTYSGGKRVVPDFAAVLVRTATWVSSKMVMIVNTVAPFRPASDNPALWCLLTLMACLDASPPTPRTVSLLGRHSLPAPRAKSPGSDAPQIHPLVRPIHPFTRRSSTPPATPDADPAAGIN